MDINCDMGESFGKYILGNDAALMPMITSANIACGLHAGDPLVMHQTIRLAKDNGVQVGAHPGYPDLQGFGRRNMEMSAEEVEALVLYQLGALAGFARAEKMELVHVKPHGALYNQAAKDRSLANAIAGGVAKFSHDLILVGLAGSLLVEAGKDMGLNTANEGFPERGYLPDGSLMPRKMPGAMLELPQDAAAQARRLVRVGIDTPSGKTTVDTLCIHGDSAYALAILQAVRQALKEDGVTLNGLKITP